MATTSAKDAGKCKGEHGHLVNAVSDTIHLVTVTSTEDINLLIHSFTHRKVSSEDLFCVGCCAYILVENAT